VLNDTANEMALAAIFAVAAKAAPIAYKHTLKPIVKEVSRQAGDALEVAADKVLKMITAKGYPLNADIFRRRNELVKIIDLDDMPSTPEEVIRSILKQTRQSLPKASNKRPYVYNAEKNTYADILKPFIKKSEHLARNNPQYMEVSKEAAANLPSIFENSFSAKSYPSIKKSENTKYIDRKIAAIRSKGEVYPVKFTQKEFVNRDALASELLEANKGKDYGLYSMAVNKEPPGTGKIFQSYGGPTGGLSTIADILKKVKADTNTGEYELNNKEYAKRMLIDAILSMKRKLKK
jgi:hypothetical protein